MSNHTLLLAIAGTAVWMAGCASQAPAPDMRDADMKAVKEVEAAWNRDAATRDAEKYVSYYTDDAVLLLPNSPAITGKDHIRPVIQEMMSDSNFAIAFESVKMEASRGGDQVYSAGTYSITESDRKTGKPVHDKGKYLTVYRKQADGSWKAAADMISSDLPVPGAR